VYIKVANPNNAIRPCLRQINICCNVRPCRQGIGETTASGVNFSSTTLLRTCSWSARHACPLTTSSRWTTRPPAQV